jgi:hypothetical protein
MNSRSKVCAVVGLTVAVVGWIVWKVQSARSAAVTTVALIGAPTAVEADEVRTFAVSVDGKPGGTYTITTTAAADGTETTTVSAEVKVKAALYTYTYTLNSTERWQNGRLVALEASSNDDGKKHTVVAAPGDRGLAVTVNKKPPRLLAADLVTSTGVRVPAADKPRDTVMFDAEDGSETAVRVEPLPAGRVAFNGAAIDCARFKLTGKDVDAEWWFDAKGKVVRQEMKWDGHKVVLELTAVK